MENLLSADSQDRLDSGFQTKKESSGLNQSCSLRDLGGLIPDIPSKVC